MNPATLDLERPELASRVVLVPLGQDRGLTSQVLAVDEDTLLLGRILDDEGNAPTARAGDLFDVEWQGPDGLLSMQGLVQHVTDDGGWRLVLSGELRRLQRRGSVRAPVGVPARVRFTLDGQPLAAGRPTVTLTGATLDLSETGARLAFRPHDALITPDTMVPVGTELELELELSRAPLVLRARLIRIHRAVQLRQEWSVSFHLLDEAAADRIRAEVFTALRLARARGVL